MEIIEANDEIENIENLFDFEDSSCPPWEDDAKGPHTATDDSFLTCDASRTCVSPVPPTSAPTCCLGLDTSKAGMEGLDKGRIEQIITQASMGSKFYKNEVRKEKQLAARIVQMKKDLEAVTQAQQQAFCRSADAEMASLERERNLGHIVVHIDMDAFYAAVEMRDNPSLRDVPMAVGGMGMLSTSNYLARRFGVRAAMPGFIGRKLCPQLVIIKPNYDKYHAVSEQVQRILEVYDPHFCPMGLDESYLDLTSYVTAKMAAQDETSETTPSKGAAGSREMSSLKDGMEGHVTLSTSHGNDSGANLAPVPADGSDPGAHQTPVAMHGNDSGAGLAPVPGDGNDSGACLTPLLAPHDLDVKDTLTLPSTLPSTPLDLQEDTLGSPQLPRAFWECGQAVVREIRERVYQSTGLTASAGIATNKMLAKIASDINKPNGQCFVEPTRDGILQFVWQLPIRKISGVGKVTEKTLASLGITTCKELYEKRGILPIAFSKASCDFFFRVSLGIGSFSVNREHQRKSMSTERTFAVTSDPTLLQEKCLNLCQALIKDIQDEGLRGKTVTLKLKTDQFEVKSRAATLPTAVASLEQLYQAASKLLATEISSYHPKPLPLRLMGVRVSSFESSNTASPRGTIDTLFRSSSKRTAKADQSPNSTPLKHDGVGRIQEAGPPCCHDTSRGCEPTYTECSTQCRAGPSCSRDDMLEEGGGGPDSMLECPVCGECVTMDNKTLNSHIDECLNIMAIHTLQDVGHPDGARGTPTNKICAVKRKSGDQAHASVKKLRTSHTLDHFWNVT